MNYISKVIKVSALFFFILLVQYGAFGQTLSFEDMRTFDEVGSGADWTYPDGTGRTAYQKKNTSGAVFLVSQDSGYLDNVFKGTIKVDLGDWDNDDIGFAFGFNGVNDTYIWSWDKGGISHGGVRSGGAHLLYKKNSSSIYPGAYIDKGPDNDPWDDGVTYQVEILYTENIIRIKVNGVLKLEATADDAGVDKFPAGKFGFYNYSQGAVTFGNIQKAQGSDNQIPPSAQDDSYGMSPNTTLTVNSLDGILKNDYDANLDDFSIVKVSDVSNGSLSLNTNDGSFTYTPTAGYQGPDEFTYKLVQDNNSTESAVRSVTIGIINNNQSPTDIQLSNSTISEGAVNNTGIGTLTTTDSNNPDDRHDYSLSDNASGRFTVIGNSLVVANSSLLTPGNYTITVKTTDLFGLSYSENFTISVVSNSKPTSSDNQITLMSGENYTFSSSDFSFNDTDGDTFNGIRIETAETSGDLEFDGSDVFDGTLINDITLLNFKSSVGSLGSPFANFTFKVLDSRGAISTDTYQMNINLVSTVSSSTITITEQSYNGGTAITVSPTVTLLGNTLTEGTDFTTSFSNNINAGTASLTIEGIGNYIGSKTVSFTILKADMAISPVYDDISKFDSDDDFIPILKISDPSTIPLLSPSTNSSPVYWEASSVYNGDSFLDNGSDGSVIVGYHFTPWLESPQAWSAGARRNGDYLILDLQQTVWVYGLVTKGRANGDQWVKKADVEYSSDKTTWNTGLTDATLNSDRSSAVTNYFSTPVKARYVKITVRDYYGFPSIRAGVLYHPANITFSSYDSDIVSFSGDLASIKGVGSTAITATIPASSSNYNPSVTTFNLIVDYKSISSVIQAGGTWKPLIKLANFDPNDDQQSVKDNDLVGDATNAMLETQKATYTFSPENTTDEVYYFRVRMGASHKSGKLGTSFYLALDKDNDYIADVFVEANIKGERGKDPYVAFHISDPSEAGTGPSNTGWVNSSNNSNIERQLTSRDAFIKAYDADTDLDNDETDTWIEFAFTEESLKSFVSDALGTSIDGDSMFAIYTFTSTGQTANGDIGGINDKTADLTKTWEELGIVIKGSLNEVTTNAILAPSVKEETFSSLTPTISGTWGNDQGGTDTLAVAVNGVTYTSSGSDLTVDGYSWSLTIPDANTLTAGTSYTVSATTIRSAESKTATNTIYIQDNDATLSAITLSDLTLSPSFSSGTYSYSASASSTLNSTDLVATLNSVSSTLSIDGVVQSSSVSVTNALAFGTNSITITVLAENGVNSNTYQIDILKQIDPIIVVNDNTTREPIAEITGTISAAPAQSGNFSVSLPEAPLSDVVITLVVSDNTEATISPSTLTFTSGNYSTTQTVTLTGIDDTEGSSLRDGPQSFTVTGTVTSSDPAYNGVIISPIGFTNLDGDPPGISVELTGPTISESGNSITANFSLLSTLTSNDTQVDLPLTLNDGSEASFSNSSVVTSATISFTNTQTTTSIIIYGVDDSLSDGTQSVTLVTGDPSSTVGTADTGYNDLVASDVADLSFSVTDNEFVSDIYTDFGGYWSSGISSINSTKPNNNHDLLGFTFGGTTYSTGVNDGVLTTNSVTFTAGEFRALPINLLPNTYKNSYYVTLGNFLDGSETTVQSPTNNFPAYPSKTKLAEYLTDGVNGLNLGTGFANIPSGSRLEFNINAIDNTNIGDGEPDFLVSQIAAPGNSKLDEFWFEDVNGNMVGNKVVINLSLQDVLGVWRTDRFTLDGESRDNLIDRDRDIRFKAFEISEFGVTSSNSASIKKLVYILSGASDPAFIAYNVPTVSMPTKLSKSAGSTTYKYNTVLTTPISIQVKDASDNNVTQAGITITAGVQSGTATLSGTLEVETDANGVATFTDLTINGTGDQELKFTAPGLDTATTTLSFERITTTMSGFPDFTVNTLQEPFALTPPTTNSTAPIIYSSTNTAVATVDSSTGSVTVVGAGTTSITAFVIQNDYYTAGTITATMTVIKSDATIIDFTDITKTFGDADFPLTGTSSSTGAITYTVSDTTVATVSGNTVTIVGAGTTSITLTQASDDTYNSATATITLMVNKATPSYTVTDVTKTYDDPAFNIDSSMLVSSSTGTLTFTVSDTTVATLTGTNTLNIQGAGSTVITAVQSATDNYTTGTTSFTLSVDKNNAVILSDSSSPISDVTLAFSDPSFAKTATSSSTGSFTFTSSNTDVITLSTTATTTTSKTVSHTIAGAGTSIITVSQAADANYNAATVSYTVTVTKADPNLSAISDITKTYGDANDTVINTLSTTTAIQYTSSNPSVVQIASTEVGSDTQTATLAFTGAGTAIVTATLSETANYESATTSFTVTVTKATPTLSGFADITKTYGDADFSLVQPTSNSDGSFTYASSNTATATITGDKVSMAHSGNVVITATQAATANYNSGSISLTLTINKGTQNINVSPLPNTKPLKDFTTIPLTATSSSGNPVNVSLASGSVATLSGTSVFGNSTLSNGATCLTSGPLWFTPTTSGYIKQIELNAFGTGETASLAIKSDFCGTPSLLGTSNNITMIDGWNTWIFSSPVQVTANTTYYITSDDASACLGVRWAQSGDDPTTGNVDTMFSCNNDNNDVASKITVVNSLNQSANYELTSIGTTGIITVTFSVDATTRYNAASVSLSMDVVKTAQSISYAPALPTEVTYSNALTVPLTASASSGLGVSYNVISGPAILTGTSLTISQTGVVVVEASQVGNAAYNPAPADTKTIVVKPGTVTLSDFSLPMKVDSDPDFTITAPTSTVPGTIVYSSSNLSVANMNGNTVEIIAAGTTSITATQLAIPNKYNSASITTNFVVAVGDTDGDGVLDPVDLCPNTIAGASVDANGCAPYQKDTDADGVMDDVDNCVTTANADQADTDGDGVGDVCDNAPNTPNADQADTDGDGIPDAEDEDDDNDGVLDTEDDFPTDPNETTDTDGDGQGDNADTDLDNDGVLNSVDNCPTTPNANQLDTDGDGSGDVCDLDDDGDGYSDADEIACGSDPLLASSLPADADSDGIPDCIDIDDDNDGYLDTDEITCGSDPLLASSSPLDTDADGIPDCIDTDDDGDGVLDTEDAFPLDKDEWTDTDGDGIGNNADTDDDNDGQLDVDEIACGSDPLDNASLSTDFDQDGIPDCVDTDDDNDGVLDTSDAFPLDPSEWTDTDGDGIGNNADEDDDNDGQSDYNELLCGSDPLKASSMASDIDGDTIPDCIDEDIDGDGCINTQDVFPRDPSECSDADGDGLGDNIDIDSDNDGIPNSQDAFPLDASESKDTDGDGIGDNADTDNNNDGFNDSDLLVSGVLTPNSSGLESTWKIINLDKYPNARVSVYNKNGQEVFSAQGYRNDWRGTYKNSADPLPASSYYYVIELNTGEKPITGWMYITY